MAESNLVKFNVGGQMMVTYKSTLDMLKVLRARIDSELSLTRVDGAYFLDRDPAAFGALLKVLRGHAAEPCEQALAATEADYWGVTLPYVRTVECSAGELRILPSIWDLLPVMPEECAAALRWTNGSPRLELSTLVVEALQDLQRAVALDQAMAPRYWHVLRQRFGLTKRIPLHQVLPADVDQYAPELEICWVRGANYSAQFCFRDSQKSWNVTLYSNRGLDEMLQDALRPTYPDLRPIKINGRSAEDAQGRFRVVWAT